ncbi:MAG: LacI family DNA-binding transcriptional regulator [Clostridia bacterium]|nr:LacI family DNA-binding transcriptional regulator [Clostridia bacterium]
MSVTIKDVAKLAGVGVGTVSRVINDEKSVIESKRIKVKQAMKQLKYTPNRMASRLRRNETRNIALLVPIVDHPFFAKLAYYVEDEADRFGYSVILVSSQQRVDKEREIIERIHRREVDGAVFVTHYEHEGIDLEGCPIVSIDRSFDGNTPYVTSNNYDATKDALKYMIERGCKKVGFLGSKPLVKSEVSERERAYLDVVNEYGLTPMIVNEVMEHGEEKSVATSFMEKFGDADGVFVSGYSLSQVFYETAQEMNKKIPKDLQIVSYDGVFRQWHNLSLTTVEQPVEEMARQVIRLLIKKIRGEETATRTVLTTRFVLGKTTK